MTDIQAVFLDLATVSRDDIDLSPLETNQSNWTYWPTTRPEETAARTKGARILVSNKVVLDRTLLQSCRNLELICIAATGTNNIDLDAARELGVRVCNVAGYSTPSVVQHVFAMILNLTTRQPEYAQAVASGRWQQSDQFCLLDYPFRELSGRRIGIVGYGELGQAVARVANAFDMEVILANRPGSSPTPGRISLHDLLPQVDILSLHCPLTAQTRGLIGAREFELMRPEALLINCARGGIVDEYALALALQSGMIGGAGIDVLGQEPPTNDNPLLAPGIPNLILTPHVAWASRESRQRLINEVAANIEAYLTGIDRNVVV